MLLLVNTDTAKIHRAWPNKTLDLDSINKDKKLKEHESVCNRFKPVGQKNAKFIYGTFDDITCKYCREG